MSNTAKDLDKVQPVGQRTRRGNLSHRLANQVKLVLLWNIVNIGKFHRPGNCPRGTTDLFRSGATARAATIASSG